MDGSRSMGTALRALDQDADVARVTLRMDRGRKQGEDKHRQRQYFQLVSLSQHGIAALRKGDPGQSLSIHGRVVQVFPR
jgi:hypothetical protein